MMIPTDEEQTRGQGTAAPLRRREDEAPLQGQHRRRLEQRETEARSPSRPPPPAVVEITLPDFRDAGILFERGGDGRPVVRGLTASARADVAATVAPGMLLSKIAGVRCKPIEYANALDLVRALERPLVLTFERPEPPPPIPREKQHTKKTRASSSDSDDDSDAKRKRKRKKRDRDKRRAPDDDAEADDDGGANATSSSERRRDDARKSKKAHKKSARSSREKKSKKKKHRSRDSDSNS